MSLPTSRTTIETEELRVLYNLFLSVWNADHCPTPENARRIVSAYKEAAEFYYGNDMPKKTGRKPK